MKALVIRMIRRPYAAYALLTLLDQDDAVAGQLRPLLPCANTATFPPAAPGSAAWPYGAEFAGLIGCVGRHLVARLTPWATHGRAAACDGTPLATDGSVWHKTPRAPGVIPPSSTDTEAGRSKSGWHGWWYSWKLHLAVMVGAI